MTRKKQNQPNPILPRTNLAGFTLGMVTVVMSFLACIALGATLLVGVATQHWLTRTTSAMTVQIIETKTQTAQEQVEAVMRVLQDTPDIDYIEQLDKPALTGLLEPWLGAGNVPEDLPLPVIITITPRDYDAFSGDVLQRRLQAVAPGAQLDTHGLWRKTLQDTAWNLRLFSILILALVGFATATVILLSVRAGFATNVHTLEVLHQIGAHDGYIARLFDGHFTRLTLISATIGTVLASAIFYSLRGIIVEAASIEFLVQLLPVPIAIILLVWYITHSYVMRALSEMV